MTIRSCLDRKTADFLAGKRVKDLEQCAKAAPKALAKLEAAEQLIDLRHPPSNKFKALQGEDGRYSIRIDRKWRICFSWEPREGIPDGTDIMTVPGDAIDVEINNHYD